MLRPSPAYLNYALRLSFLEAMRAVTKGSC
jgi:hypothetical protein